MSVLANIESKAYKKGDPEPPAPPKGVVRVYNMRFCPWAHRVILYLAKLGVPSEVINIDLNEKPEWYFKKHPEGKVPAVEIDGKIVLESGLIPEFLDDLFPEKRILPADPYEKYQQKLILEQLSNIGPSFYGLFQAIGNAAVKEEKHSNAQAVLKNADALLTDTLFGGVKAGYVDYLLFPLIQRIYLLTSEGYTPFSKDGFPGNDFPNISRWWSAISQLPEVKISHPVEKHILTFMKGYLKGERDFDLGL